MASDSWVSLATDEGAASPITLILNWKPKL